MNSNEQNLSFGNIKERTGGSSPSFERRRRTDMLAKDYYQAFYGKITPSLDDCQVLATIECLVGCPLQIDWCLQEGAVGSTPCLRTPTGVFCGLLDRLDLSQLDVLRQARDKGWTIRCHVSYVVYAKQTNTLWAEVAFFAYDNALEALDVFVNNLEKRITRGEHPGISLQQNEFKHVLESKGSWCLTKAVPLPHLEEGEVTFKKRRNLADSLAKEAGEGNKGCLVASIIAWVVIIGFVAWFIISRFI